MFHLVTAVVDPSRLDPVLDVLTDAGISRATVTPGLTHRPWRRCGVYRGAEQRARLVPCIRVEVVCDIFDAERVADLIARAAGTGRVGDGHVRISPLDRLLYAGSGDNDLETI